MKGTNKTTTPLSLKLYSNVHKIYLFTIFTKCIKLVPYTFVCPDFLLITINLVTVQPTAVYKTHYNRYNGVRRQTMVRQSFVREFEIEEWN